MTQLYRVSYQPTSFFIDPLSDSRQKVRRYCGVSVPNKTEIMTSKLLKLFNALYSVIVVRCHAPYAWQRNMYLFKIGFSQITPSNLNGSR